MKPGPQSIGDILSSLMARKGFARVQGSAALEAAWKDSAGELMAKYTRVGQIRRGTLEVLVANSTLLQELGFQKQNLLNSLAQLLPDEKIENLRFRVGNVE
jgi:predicted nucleic acid-binding Zn ribbon protein